MRALGAALDLHAHGRGVRISRKTVAARSMHPPAGTMHHELTKHDLAGPELLAPFPIVGVGASAGGLDAFTQLLLHLPADTGFGFVLIQHLDRTHPSLLSETLSRATAMPVCQAEDGMHVEPNHVYVIAPNTDLALHGGQLVQTRRPSDGQGLHLPIDFFLRSLARELGTRAIGVVLSGSASDGTDGLRAVRADDGITFAQDPRAAKFPGMPQSAVDAGVVDYCLGIPTLADELVRLSQHPYAQQPSALEQDPDDEVREAIFACVRETIGVDFSEFKPSTVRRRLTRRVLLRKAVDFPAYLALLKTDPDEIRALYEDMLIHVTSFFRDPQTFDSLRTHVFPEIVRHKPAGATLRVWIAGCSSGEEVYSFAIALLEFAAGTTGDHPIQIFGSDVSALAIQKARLGVYGETALRGVSDERRARYFSKVDGGYCIQKSVRDLCVFVCHDLVRDPPFSKLDLVSCRNVLIYFDQALQRRVLPTLHYSLNLPGFLVLGASENIAGLDQLFSPVDKAHKIFARTPVASNLRFAPRTATSAPIGRSVGPGHLPLAEHGALFAKHLDRLLLARYCPPGVLVDENLDVLQFRGATGAYLQPAPGKPQNNLISMARSGLSAALRATLHEAKQQMVVVRTPDVAVDHEGTTTLCDLVVAPFVGLPNHPELLFVVLFEAPQHTTPRDMLLGPALQSEASASAAALRSARLEQELAATKEYLNTVLEDHGRANDQLGTSNEELLSGNEELQSMNEELETAKEELQSMNEELTTLNDELQQRNLEVTQINSDLQNFAVAVNVPVVTLDMSLRVRRFTPAARSVLNVQPSDVGRTIDSLQLNVDVPELKQKVVSVIETATAAESEVSDKNGHWYRMQLRPHVSAEHAIDGVIMSLVDIHALKQLVAEAQSARAEAELASRAKDDFLATLSHELRTPLSSMLLNAQRVRGGDVQLQEDLRRTGEALERATLLQVKLIDDVLDVSRIVAGKLSLDLSAVDLCGVVRMALDGLDPLTQAKSLAIRLALDPALAPIWGDRVRVQQVVSNLLANAIKFTPRGGQITIVVEPVGQFARLSVTDTGIGIDPGFLPHVFARFSQSDSSITRTYGGLGLGLALVRHIVELQGGEVLAESGGAGQGSTFRVTFPLAQGTKRPAAKRETAAWRDNALDRPGRAQHYEALTGLRILFIDDDRQTREAVLEVLQFTGAQVQLAASSLEAMQAVDEWKPQIIVCDIAMPIEDGYTFMRKLRARSRKHGGQTPALALTALASQDDQRSAIGAGFQLHLAKPIDIDRLRDAVLELSKLTQPLPAAKPLLPD